MKLAIRFALTLLVAGSVSAQELSFIDGAPAAIDTNLKTSALLRQFSASGKINPNVIVDDVPGPSLLIPAAARVQGLFDTYFLSEVAILNYRNATQVVSIAFLEQGVNSCDAPVHTLTMPPLSVARYADFVGIALQRASGVGAVLIIARNAEGGVDGAGMIDAVSRIYTTQPGSTGTTSQSMPTVRPNDHQSAGTAVAALMRQDANYRTNVGIVNTGVDGLAHTWSIFAQGAGASTTSSVTVPACSMSQTPLPEAPYGPLMVSISTTDVTAPPAWTAYAVTLDNRTGDGWVVHAVK